MKINRLNTVLGIIVTICAACTQNPIGEDEVAAPASVIQGSVTFDRTNDAPHDVLVWLEGFDLFTRTDSNGSFNFMIPPPIAQSSMKGVTGAFNIYYYMANFGLESSRVFTQNGNLVNSSGSLNSANGELQQKVLSQKLIIKTEVRPVRASRQAIRIVAGKSDFILRVDVTLQAIRDSVIVFFPGLFQDIYGPLMFRSVKTNEVKVVTSTIAAFVVSPVDTITTEPTVRTMAVPIFPDALGLGEFEIIPFLKIEDVEVPDAISNELELDYIAPGSKYLRIPFLRSGRS